MVVEEGTIGICRLCSTAVVAPGKLGGQRGVAILQWWTGSVGAMLRDRPADVYTQLTGEA